MENNTLLDYLINYGSENEWIEFKENNHKPVEIGKRLSALGNGACLRGFDHGYLVFGVEDETLKIVGTNFDPNSNCKGKESYHSWLVNKLHPKLNLEFIQFKYEEKRIVMIKVPAAPSEPISFDKQRFIRIGSTTQSLSRFPGIEREIWLKAHETDFESLIAKDGLTGQRVLNLLDYNTYYKLRNIQLPEESKILTQFVDNGFVKRTDFNYSILNLGALLLARNIKEFPDFVNKTIRLIVYEKNDKASSIFDIEGGKGYATGFQSMINFIDKKIPNSEYISKALRIKKKKFPIIALRELIANSLIHQDLKVTGSRPMIEIYPDRIEVTNPGIPLIEIDRFIDTHPKSRNEKLAHSMRILGFCEERGSGIDKVIEVCAENLLPPPKFMKGDHYTRVVLYGFRKFKSLSTEERIRVCYQHCVLTYLKEGVFNNKTLRDRLGMDDSNQQTASRIIRDTMSADYIKEDEHYSGSRKFARYVPFWV